MNTRSPLLRVQGLTVQFEVAEESVTAVRDIAFELFSGETLGLAGESGCGKSTVAMALMHLLPENGRIHAGEVWFQNRNLAQLDEKALRPLWWKEMSIVFQGALNSLNPVKRVGTQIAEALMVRNGLSKDQAWKEVRSLFERIGIRAERATDYPHEFSGGMRQRAMIAMAVCLSPKLIIADECTTALDVMIQTQIMDLLKDLKSELDLSMLFINHDLALIADICDRVAVMYAGRIVESGPVREVFSEPHHPYVIQLLKALPKMHGPTGQLASIPGTPPRLHEIPEGCAFLPRCKLGDPSCSTRVPPLVEVRPGHLAACGNIGKRG
jgi:oligopeptide/dipeptide ABC transporter ATP-binding protein